VKVTADAPRIAATFPSLSTSAELRPAPAVASDAHGTPDHFGNDPADDGSGSLAIRIARVVSVAAPLLAETMHELFRAQRDRCLF